ncbi:LptF/LptG family permease, partial [bacterium]|nr:LptF/LptG family permease [bacterium]
ALLAAGMSPMILARPFLLCSAGLSLVLYFLSFSLSPTAQANREKVKRQIKKESTEENSFSQVVYRSPKMAGKTEGTIWYIGRLDLNAKTLQNVEILFRTEPEGRDLAKVFAASERPSNRIRKGNRTGDCRSHSFRTSTAGTHRTARHAGGQTGASGCPALAGSGTFGR